MDKLYIKLFWSRAGTGLRTGFAALLASILIIHPGTKPIITAVPFFAAALAILIVDVTLGRALHNSWLVLTGCVQAAAFAVVAQALCGRWSAAMYGALGLATFFISFCNAVSLRKKIALAVSGVLMVLAANKRSPGLLFPLKMVGTGAAGSACGIVAMLLPWPATAAAQAKKRAEFTGRCISTYFIILLEAFCAEDEASLARVRVHAKMMRGAAEASLEQLKEMAHDLLWELLPQRLLPALMRRTSPQHLQRFIKVLEQLLLHGAGMEAALADWAFLRSPSLVHRMLQNSLRRLGHVAGGALLTIAADRSLLSVAPLAGQRQKSLAKLLSDGRRCLEVFNLRLQRTREVVYYQMPVAEGEGEGEEEGGAEGGAGEGPTDPLGRPMRLKLDDTGAVISVSAASLVDSQFFVFNAKLYVLAVLHLLEDCVTTDDEHRLPHERPSLRSLDSLDDLLTASRRVSAVDGAAAAAAAPASTPAWLLHAHSRIAGGVSRVSQWLRRLSPPEGPMPPPPRGPHPLGGVEHTQRQREAVPRSQGGRWGQWGGGRVWSWLAGPADQRRRKAETALKNALAMMAAAVLGSRLDGFGFWAAVTVGFVVSSYQGGSFRVCMARLQGTVAGAIVGYLGIMVVGDHQWAVVAILVPWVSLAAFVRYSKPYGYSSIVAAFTAAIVMLGYSGSGEAVQTYALSRITQTCVGILCFIVIETLVLPSRAGTLARRELVSNLGSARQCFTSIARWYTGGQMACAWCTAEVEAEVAQLQASMMASIQLQKSLAEEAAAEPDLWFAPFPLEVYLSLLQAQRQIVRQLFFMDCALHTTTEQTGDVQIARLVHPLRDSLQELEAEALRALGSLLDALAAGAKSAAASPRKSGDGWWRQPRRSLEAPEHPLLRLGSVRPAPPRPLQRTAFQVFESQYEEVIGALIAAKRADPSSAIVHNSAMLSFNALVFSMRALIHEMGQLEAATRELLLVERPLDLSSDMATAYFASGQPLSPPRAQVPTAAALETQSVSVSVPAASIPP